MAAFTTCERWGEGASSRRHNPKALKAGDERQRSGGRRRRAPQLVTQVGTISKEVVAKCKGERGVGRARRLLACAGRRLQRALCARPSERAANPCRRVGKLFFAFICPNGNFPPWRASHNLPPPHPQAPASRLRPRSRGRDFVTDVAPLPMTKRNKEKQGLLAPSDTEVGK